MESTETVSELLVPPSSGRVLALGAWVVDRYRVVQFLGRGALGEVYLVEDSELRGARRALKVLKPERRSEKTEEILRKEVQVSHQAKSPHLLRIYDIGRQESPPLLFLTMEWAQGGSLRGELPLSSCSAERLTQVAEQVLLALVELHSQGKTHRDIKPENILLGSGGEIKLGDYGLVSLLSDPRTVSKGFVGTRGYAPPEQSQGSDPDPRSDLYSLGVVMLEMLGVTPIEEGLARIPANVTSWQRRFISRLVAGSVTDRFASARDALRALRVGWQRRRRVRFSRVVGPVLVVLVFVGLLTRPTSLPVTATEASPVHPMCTKSLSQQTRLVKGGPLLEIVVERTPRRDQQLGSLEVRIVDPVTGEIRYRVESLRPPKVLEELGYSDCFKPSDIHVVDSDQDGRQEFVVDFNHTPYFPSFSYHFDPHKNRGRHLLAASGHFNLLAVLDLDGNGILEALYFGRLNRLGWYMGLVAVSMEPFRRIPKTDPFSHVLAVTPDLSSRSKAVKSLGQVVLLPASAQHSAASVKIDVTQRLVSIPLESKRALSVPFDALVDDVSLRVDVYRQIRLAHRRVAYGDEELAVASAATAVELATVQSEELLVDLARRFHVLALLRARRVEDGLASAAELLRGEDAPAAEIAFDVAESLFLAAETELALDWYQKGYRLAGTGESGRPIPDFLEGIALSMARLGRWGELDEWIEDSERTLKLDPVRANAYRYFAESRFGSRQPRKMLRKVTPDDLTRYWQIESQRDFLEPAEALRSIEPEIPLFSEMKGAAYALLAEVLAANGRFAEAEIAALQASSHVRVESAHYSVAFAYAGVASDRYQQYIPSR